jgi:hypothetical protein
MNNWNKSYKQGKRILEHKSKPVRIFEDDEYFLFESGDTIEQIAYNYEDLEHVVDIVDKKLESEDEENVDKGRELCDRVIEILDNLETEYDFQYVLELFRSYNVPSVEDLTIIDENGILTEDFRNDVLYGDGTSLRLLRLLKEYYGDKIATDVLNTLDRVTLVEPIYSVDSIPPTVDAKVYEDLSFRDYIGYVIMTATDESDTWICIMNSDSGDYAIVIDYVAGTENTFRVTQDVIDTIFEYYGVDVTPLLQSPVSVMEAREDNRASGEDDKPAGVSRNNDEEGEGEDDVEDIVEDVDADLQKEISVLNEQIEKIESLPEDIRENERIMEIYYILLGKREYIQKKSDDDKSKEIVDSIISEIEDNIGEIDNVFLDDDRNEIKVNEGRLFEHEGMKIRPMVTGFRSHKTKTLIVESGGERKRYDITNGSRDVLKKIFKVNEAEDVANISDAFSIIGIIKDDRKLVDSFYNSLVNIAYKIDGYKTSSDYKKYIKNVVDDGDYENKSDTLPYLVNVASQDVKRFNAVIERTKTKLGM